MRSRLLVLPLAAVASAGLVATASASAAQEEPYPPAGPMLTASATAVACGSGVTLNGQDFEPGENVLISASLAPLAAPSLERDQGVESEVAAQPVAYVVPAVYTESAPAAVAPAMAAPVAAAAQPGQEVTADGDGAFTTTLPLTEVGVATITATGQTSGLSASVVITVLPDCPGAGPDTGLPKTGNSGWSLARTGVVAVGLGAVLLLTTLIWRSRRNRTRA